MGPGGASGEVLEVSETGMGIDGFSLITQGGSRIHCTGVVEGESVGLGGLTSIEDSGYRILYLGYRIEDIMQDTGLNLLTQPGGP